jgi:uncharacterized protein (TIGR02300 family)
MGVDFPCVSGYSAARHNSGEAPNMARDLGNKYVCFKCGTKFYDLKKPIPTCPKCGTDQREAPQPKPEKASRRSPAPPKEVEPEVEVPEAAAEDDDEEDEAEEKDKAAADED